MIAAVGEIVCAFGGFEDVGAGTERPGYDPDREGFFKLKVLHFRPKPQAGLPWLADAVK
jgi:hypothetical protein